MDVTIKLAPADHEALSAEALRRGVSPEQLLADLAAWAAKIARDDAWFEERRARVSQADRDWFRAFMNREGGEPPRPGDEVD